MGEHISGWVVMLLGMSIVFFGLISLIFITKLMSALCGKKEKPQAEAVPAPPAAVAAAPQADRGPFVAAIAAAVAVAMGTEPGGLKIHSIRKL